MTTELINLKKRLQSILDKKPTNQVLTEAVVTHLLEIDKIIEQEAETEKYIVSIDTRIGDNSTLVVQDVKKIAATILHIKDSEISSQTRVKEVVCARWLVVYYLDRFGNYSRKEQGAFVGKDHSTAVNIVLNIKYFTGWRKKAKVKFENTINELHKQVGIDKLFY